MVVNHRIGEGTSRAIVPLMMMMMMMMKKRRRRSRSSVLYVQVTIILISCVLSGYSCA
jgi:hypothetical protein